MLHLDGEGTLVDASLEGGAPAAPAEDLLACVRETMTDDGRLFGEGAHQRLEIDFTIDVALARP